MRFALIRQQSPNPSFFAQVALRAVGLLLLAAVLGCFRILIRWSAARHGGAAGLAEFAFALGIFAALVAGLALVIEGPGLFRLVPYPRLRLF